MNTQQVETEPVPAPVRGAVQAGDSPRDISLSVFPDRADRPFARPLRIRVRGLGLEDRPEIRDYVEKRALSVLGHLARHVECMAFTGDTVDRGPERGAFRCRVWAQLTCGRQVREDATDADLYAAIDRAAEALARDIEYLEWRLPPGEVLRCA
jgi:ribosome-associated translation inhibitor RaiA